MSNNNGQRPPPVPPPLTLGSTSTSRSISLGGSSQHDSAQSLDGQPKARAPALPPRATSSPCRPGSPGIPSATSPYNSLNGELPNFPNTPAGFGHLNASVEAAGSEPAKSNAGSVGFDAEVTSAGPASSSISHPAVDDTSLALEAGDLEMPIITIYDPDHLWSRVERPIKVYMPLRNLHLPSPSGSGVVTIDQLAVKIMVYRSKRALDDAVEKANSPTEWFKGSFCHIFMITAESQEQYKTEKRALVKQWLEGFDGGEGWLVLYVNVAPQIGHRAADDMHGKIFGWIQADFYSKVPGDRSALVSLYVDNSEKQGGKANSPRHHPKQWKELINKLGAALCESFASKCQMYESELERLYSKSASPGWDFGPFFLVKESLALMYRELQMTSECLIKYQELAALIMSMGMNHDIGSSGNAKSRLLFGTVDQACSMLDYRRMRFRHNVVAGKLESAVLETQLYIFGRECGLFLELQRPADMAKCAGAFIPAYLQELLGRKDMEEHEVRLWGFKACWDVLKASSAYFATNVNATVETERQSSLQLVELVRFAIEQLLAYARAAPGEGIGESIVWELVEKGSLEKLQDWHPGIRYQGEQEGATRDHEPLKYHGRMAAPQYQGTAVALREAECFWDSDEEGEVIPADTTKMVNPVARLLEAAVAGGSPTSEGGHPLSSREHFEAIYLQVTYSLTRCLLKAGLVRMASEVQCSRAEMFMAKGEWGTAAELLKEQAAECRGDGWSLLEASVLQKLVRCLKELGDHESYVGYVLALVGLRQTDEGIRKLVKSLVQDIDGLVANTEMEHEQPMSTIASAAVELVPAAAGDNAVAVGELFNVILRLESALPEPLELLGIELDLRTVPDAVARPGAGRGKRRRSSTPSPGPLNSLTSSRSTSPVPSGSGPPKPPPRDGRSLHRTPSRERCGGSASPDPVVACTAHKEGPLVLNPGSNTIELTACCMVPHRIKPKWVKLHWGHLVLRQDLKPAAVRGTSVPPNRPQLVMPQLTVLPYEPSSYVSLVAPSFLPKGQLGTITARLSSGADKLSCPVLALTSSSHALLMDGDASLITDEGESPIAAKVVADGQGLEMDLPSLEEGQEHHVEVSVLGGRDNNLGDLLVLAKLDASVTAGHSSADTAPGVSVPCSIHGKSKITIANPFGATVGCRAAAPDLLFAEVVLTSRAPTPLTLEEITLEAAPGMQVLEAPSALLIGERLTPGQELRLSIQLRCSMKESVEADADGNTNAAQLLVTYKAELTKGAFTSFSCPVPLAVPAQQLHTAASGVVITCFNKLSPGPQDGAHADAHVDKSDVAASLGSAALVCTVGEPQDLECWVEVAGGSEGDPPLVCSYQVPRHYHGQWMPYGNIKGKVLLQRDPAGSKGQQLVASCRVMPVECGLLTAPEVTLTVKDGGDGDTVTIWPAAEQEVLVVPVGETVGVLAPGAGQDSGPVHNW
ncbi:unnamed protein product [Chrysoparadoxa australica]